MAARWIDSLEKKAADWAMPGLAAFLVAANGAVGLLSALKPEFPARLSLEPQSILQGEVWRLATFLIVPPALEPMWMLFWLLMLFSILRALENAWGDFRFNLFTLLGAAFVCAYAMITGLPASDTALLTSFFLAFARLFPELEVLVFFVLPVKVRWLGRVAWAMIFLQFLTGGLLAKVHVLAGLGNYLVFFGDDHWMDLKFYLRRRQNSGRFK